MLRTVLITCTTMTVPVFSSSVKDLFAHCESAAVPSALHGGALGPQGPVVVRAAIIRCVFGDNKTCHEAAVKSKKMEDGMEDVRIFSTGLSVPPFDYNSSEATRDQAAMSPRNPRAPSDYSPDRYFIFNLFHGSLLCFPLFARQRAS